MKMSASFVLFVTLSLGCSSTYRASEHALVLTFHPVVKETEDGAVRISQPINGDNTIYYNPAPKLTDIRVESVVQRPCETTCWVSARFSEKDAERLNEFRKNNPAKSYLVLIEGTPLTVVDLAEIETQNSPREIYHFLSRGSTEEQRKVCNQITGR
jgi:hypothetical protein